MTTQTQIDTARKFAEILQKYPLVDQAWIDDWDDYGGFNLFIHCKNIDRHTTIRLLHLLSRLTRYCANSAITVFQDNYNSPFNTRYREANPTEGDWKFEMKVT